MGNLTNWDLKVILDKFNHLYLATYEQLSEKFHEVKIMMNYFA